MRSARALPLAALVLLPLANGAITGALAGARGLHPRVRRGLDSFLAYSARLRALDRASRWSGLVLAPLALIACFALLETPGIRAATGFPSGQFPVAAYSHIPGGARLFAPDKFGGYLIYRSARRAQSVFRRPQRFLRRRFSQAIWSASCRSALAGGGIGTLSDFTHALLPPGAPLAAALEQAGWRPIYSDQTAILLAGAGT